MWGQILGTVTKPFFGYLGKREQRKTDKQNGEAKLAQLKQSGDQEVTIKDVEWEAISKGGENGTWKDEYVTVIITFYIPALILGGIHGAFTGTSTMIDGVNEGLKHISAMGVDMGYLTMVVVTAAVGLKLWRGAQ